MRRATSRRAVLAACGASAASLSGCLRLAEDEQTAPEDGETQRGGGGGGDDTSVPENFEIEFTEAWTIEDPVSNLTAADGDFFVRISRSDIKRVTPDGDDVFTFDGVSDDYWVTLGQTHRAAFEADETGVYVGVRPDDDSEGGRIYALDPETGAERWQFDEPADGWHDSISEITRIDDLLIYVSQSSGSGSDQETVVRALNIETGDEAWRIDRSGEFVNGLAAIGTRLFVQGTFGYAIYDLSTREMLDEQRLHLGFARPRLSGETVYFGREELRSLTLPSGEEQWAAETAHENNTQPSVGSLGVYFGTEAGFVLGHDRETGEQLWEARADGVINQAPTVEGGVVWIGDERGTISGFSERSGEVVYSEDIEPGFSFAVQDGMFLDQERQVAFEIQYT